MAGIQRPGILRQVNIHFIRDLSGWAPQQGGEWEPEKEVLLQKFCHSLVNPDANELFLIAANDGQLIESWRRLQQTEEVQRARQLFEDLLVEDRQERSGIRLKFFNLSRADSADLFDRALDAFLNHPGWDELRNLSAGDNELFGARCPIRHNFELLQTALVRSRLRSLLELCDRNGLHVPIRQILILLTNAVLGHTDCKDGLMTTADVPKVIAAGTISKASLFNNIFGGNLSENRRLGVTIFDYLERFQIGHETSNRVDNLLIFGEQDEHLSPATLRLLLRKILSMARIPDFMRQSRIYRRLRRGQRQSDLPGPARRSAPRTLLQDSEGMGAGA